MSKKTAKIERERICSPYTGSNSSVLRKPEVNFREIVITTGKSRKSKEFTVVIFSVNTFGKVLKVSWKVFCGKFAAACRPGVKGWNAPIYRRGNLGVKYARRPE